MSYVIPSSTLKFFNYTYVNCDSHDAHKLFQLKSSNLALHFENSWATLSVAWTEMIGELTTKPNNVTFWWGGKKKKLWLAISVSSQSLIELPAKDQGDGIKDLTKEFTKRWNHVGKKVWRMIEVRRKDRSSKAVKFRKRCREKNQWEDGERCRKIQREAGECGLKRDWNTLMAKQTLGYEPLEWRLSNTQ